MGGIFNEYLITVHNAYWEFVGESNAISIISSFYKVFLEIMFVFAMWFIGSSILFNFFSSKMIFLDVWFYIFVMIIYSSWNQISSVSAPWFFASLSVLFIVLACRYMLSLDKFHITGKHQNPEVCVVVFCWAACLSYNCDSVKCHRYPFVATFLCLVCCT